MATSSSRDIEASPSQLPVLGIDFGTSKLCAAVYRNERVFVVTNEYEERLTPCYVEFAKDRCNIGESAQKNASKNPKNTVYGVKRLMGRQYSDIELQSNKRCAITIIKRNNRPQIQVHTEKMKFDAEEIIAMIIGKIKSRAEMQYGTTFQQVVIAVPAQFNNAQRKATQNAGRIAGFEEVFLINEPTATALTYEMFRESDADQTILVFDLGAGCFDVSVCKVSKLNVCVIATRGDTSFGGDDFDNRMLHRFAKIIKEKHDKNIYKDEKAQIRLRSECEKAKIQLSESTNAEIQVEFYGDDDEFKHVLKRDEFNKINEEFFHKIEGSVFKVLEDANISQKKVDEVIVVGGSFRISRVEEFLNKTFKKVNRTLNTDEAVVTGAAIYADHVRQIQHEHAGSRVDSPELQKPTKRSITDIVSRSPHDVAENNRRTEIIQRNKQVRYNESLRKLLNESSTGESLFFWFLSKLRMAHLSYPAGYELREKNANNEKILGFICVENQTGISIEIDSNGIFRVKKYDKEVLVASGETTKEEIKKMIANSKKVNKKYRELREKREAKNEFEKSIYKRKETVKSNEYQKVISPEQTELILKKCDQGLNWLETNKDATADGYIKEKKDLESYIDDIFTTTQRKKQFEEELGRRKSRHELQTLLFEITSKVPEDNEMHRKCIEIENAIESQKVNTRKDFEQYCRALRKEWKISETKKHAETQTVESADGLLEELGRMMWAVMNVASHYQIHPTLVRGLVCAYETTWTWMSGRWKPETVDNMDKFGGVIKQIDSLAQFHRLPQNEYNHLEHAHQLIWAQMTSHSVPEESLQNK